MTLKQMETTPVHNNMDDHQEHGEMVPIKEYYEVDKECVNSVRYKPSSKNSPLAGMTIYVPRSVLKSEEPPARILISVQVADTKPVLVEAAE